jgi:serine/threonine-protein kinase RsbW
MTEDATTDKSFVRRFVLNEWDAARDAQEEMLGAIERLGYPASSLFAVRLALEEAISNAFRHGNKNDPSKSVTIQCQIDDQAVRVDVADEGEGFDIDAVPDPTEAENLEIPSGRGIVLMQSFMSEVTYDPPGNRVHMTYWRPRDAAA